MWMFPCQLVFLWELTSEVKLFLCIDKASYSYSRGTIWQIWQQGTGSESIHLILAQFLRWPQELVFFLFFFFWKNEEFSSNRDWSNYVKRVNHSIFFKAMQLLLGATVIKVCLKWNIPCTNVCLVHVAGHRCLHWKASRGCSECQALQSSPPAPPLHP